MKVAIAKLMGEEKQIQNPPSLARGVETLVAKAMPTILPTAITAFMMATIGRVAMGKRLGVGENLKGVDDTVDVGAKATRATRLTLLTQARATIRMG